MECVFFFRGSGTLCSSSMQGEKIFRSFSLNVWRHNVKNQWNDKSPINQAIIIANITCFKECQVTKKSSKNFHIKDLNP